MGASRSNLLTIPSNVHPKFCGVIKHPMVPLCAQYNNNKKSPDNAAGRPLRSGRRDSAAEHGTSYPPTPSRGHFTALCRCQPVDALAQSIFIDVSAPCRRAIFFYTTSRFRARNTTKNTTNHVEALRVRRSQCPPETKVSRRCQPLNGPYFCPLSRPVVLQRGPSRLCGQTPGRFGAAGRCHFSPKKWWLSSSLQLLGSLPTGCTPCQSFR